MCFKKNIKSTFLLLRSRFSITKSTETPGENPTNRSTEKTTFHIHFRHQCEDSLIQLVSLSVSCITLFEFMAALLILGQLRVIRGEHCSIWVYNISSSLVLWRGVDLSCQGSRAKKKRLKSTNNCHWAALGSYIGLLCLILCKKMLKSCFIVLLLAQRLHKYWSSRQTY